MSYYGLKVYGGKQIEIKSDDYIDGKYIVYTGNIGTLSSYSYIKPFFVKKGNIVKATLRGTSGTSCAIAVCESSSSTTFTPKVVADTNDISTYEYTAEEDTFVTVSGKKSDGFIVYVFDPLQSQIESLKDEIGKIEDKTSVIDGVTENVDVSDINIGYIIASNGKVGSFASNAYGYTKPIYLKKNETIICEATEISGAIAVISKPIIIGSQYEVLVIADNTFVRKEYTATEDMYVVCSGKISDLKVWKKKTGLTEQTNELYKLLSAEKVDIDIEKESGSGYYILSSDGSTKPLNSYTITQKIHLKAGQIIVADISGTSGVNAAIAFEIRRLSQYKTIIPCDFTGLKTYKWQAENECDVVLCGSKQSLSAYIENPGLSGTTTFISQQNEKNNEKIKENCGNLFHYWFNKVLCCGDSVTMGHVYDYPRTGTQGKVLANYAYPTQLAKMTGWDITMSGRAGWSTIKWWEDYYNTNDYTQYQLCLIELGYNGGLTDTLQEDVIERSGIEDYAETNTGCYCKIVESMKLANPHLLIVLMMSPLFKEVDRKVVMQIAERYNVPVFDLSETDYIDLNDLRWHGYTSGTTYNMIHFNCIGYLAKAKLIYHLLSKLFVSNAKEINNIRFDDGLWP